MDSKYIVRPYRPGDEAEIVELLELVFDGWPPFDLNCTPLDHWTWKYLDNPLRINSNVIGLSENKIIGCNHGYYVKIKIGSKSLLCQHGGDLAVHPDYRRIGVNTKMRELKKELQKKHKCDLTYSVTGNPILIESSKRRKRPRFPHPVLDLVRIADINLHLKQSNLERTWLKKYEFLFLKKLNKFRSIHKPSSRSAHARRFNVEEINKFDDRIETFWNEIKDHYSFIVEKGMEYLNWRYCDPRGGNHIIKTVDKEGCILGYSVLSLNRQNKKYPRGQVVDLLTLPKRSDVVDALAEDAVQYFDDHSVNIIHYWVPKNHLNMVLFMRHGFLNTRNELYVAYRPMRAGKEFEEFRKAPVEQVHFQHGDVDGI